MIEKFSKFLATKLIINDSPTESYLLEVYQYGIECIINTFIPLFIIFIYSLLIHQGIEMIIWTFSFLALRNYLGGYHATSHIRCMCISTIVGIIVVYMQSISPYSYIVFKLTSTVFCFAFYVKFGPITQEDFSIEIRQKLYVHGIFLFLFLIIIFSVLMYFKIFIGNSVFFGILTAWFFYAIQIKRNVHTSF